MIDAKKVDQTLRVYFVSDDVYRPNMNGIYNNGSVIAATTGYLFVEIDLSVWPDFAQIEDSVPEGEFFPDYIERGIIPAPTPDKTFTVELEKLFTDPDDIVEDDKETSEPCNLCAGSGVVMHTCSCDYCEYSGDEECYKCDGSGKIYKNADHHSYTHINGARFRSIYINRVVLLLRCFGIETVSLYQKSNHSSLLISAEGLTCIVSPVMIGELQDNQSIVNEITIEKSEVTA